MSIFTNPSKVLGHFFDWFSDESKVVLDFLKPTLQMFERDGKKALIAAAVSAVAQAKDMDVTSGDKREEALKIITTSLGAAGIAFIESEARVALELAYQALLAKAA